ncbi:MAG: hypothetical protein Q8M07_01630 [Prosthecobacter sp.]|nr:hypothetical protein [Prosthecobacter sp.]
MFALVGFLAGPFIGGMMLSMLKLDGSANQSKWILFFMVGGGALALWVFVRMHGKAEEKVLLDPRTRRRVGVTKTKHILFFLPPVFWAVIMSVFAVLSLNVVISIPDDPFSMPSGKASRRGVAAFENANELLTGLSEGRAHGNTQEAKVLAEAFSDALKEARNIGIEKRSRSSIFSHTKGDFLTYCLLTEQSCIFMVHVPDLRNFATDAKELIAEAGWLIALKILKGSGLMPTKLAVGLRGAMFYDRVTVGDKRPSDQPGMHIERIVHGDTDSRTELAVQFEAASNAGRGQTGKESTMR